MSEGDKTLPVTRVNEVVPDMRGGIKTLTKKGITFLQNYAESMDETEAAKIAKYASAWEPKQDPAIVAEMERIDKAFFYGIRMNANFAGGEHERLMQKFEEKYDGASEDNKAKLANTLAKMSETRLKATGKIGPDGKNGSPLQVVINMDMSGTKKPAIVIDGEVDGG